MENCLVTKMKSLVDNPSLKKRDEVRLFVVPQTRNDSVHNTRLDIDHYAGGYTIRVTGDGYFALSEADLDIPANRKTTYTWTSNSSTRTSFFFGPQPCDVFISNKFSIYQLMNVGSTTVKPYVCADLSELSYMTNLKRIRFSYNDTCGDISNLKKLVNMEHIGLSNTKITGDVINFQPMKDHIVEVSLGQTGVTGHLSDFSPLTKLNDFSLNEPNVDGSVESFVAGQISAGRTTCNNLSGVGMFAYITFGGSIVPFGNSYTCINWESNERIFVGNRQYLNDATVIYAKGATAEEIAAWKTANKTVYAYENGSWVQK